MSLLGLASFLLLLLGLTVKEPHDFSKVLSRQEY